MWGRKDQELSGAAEPTGLTGAPGLATSRPAATNPARGSVQSAPPEPTAHREPRGPTTSRIAKSVKFKGDIHSDEDLVVDGDVEGTINIPKNVLVIGANSRVKAEIHAHSLVLGGQLAGKVTVVERIEIKKTGSLHGNLVTHRIVIEHGGIFRGTCDTRSPEARAAVTSKAKPGRGAGVAPAKSAKAVRPAGGSKA